MSDLQRVGSIWGATGTPVPLTADPSGAQRISVAHGKHYDAVRQGAVFVAHNVAAQAVSVALATTYTGLVLSNPIGNTRYLILLGAQYALSVAPAAIASLHLIGGYSATNVVHTTPLAAPGIQCALLNGSVNAASAKVDSAATIPTPGYIWPLVSGFTAAALPSMSPSFLAIDGMLVIPPGGFVAIGALTAVTGFGAFCWEEVPILP